jgi:hypothetical protein
MRNLIGILLGSWLVFLPYGWAVKTLNASDDDKVNLIACQRVSALPVSVVQCRHERSAFLWQPATQKSFELRQVTLKTYRDSCGENDCNYLMLNLDTNDGAIEIRDFQNDTARANIQKDRFDALLANNRDQVNLRYENSLSKEFLKVLLFMLTVAVWLITMLMVPVLMNPKHSDD